MTKQQRIPRGLYADDGSGLGDPDRPSIAERFRSGPAWHSSAPTAVR